MIISLNIDTKLHNCKYQSDLKSVCGYSDRICICVTYIWFFFLNKWAKFSVFNLIVMIIVPILYNNQLVETTYFELKSMPVKPGSLYHDEPADIPRGQGYCVVCGTKTILQCCGCLLKLKDVFPFCPTSVRDCFQKMHEMRNEIWIS